MFLLFSLSSVVSAAEVPGQNQPENEILSISDADNSQEAQQAKVQNKGDNTKVQNTTTSDTVTIIEIDENQDPNVLPNTLVVPQATFTPQAGDILVASKTLDTMLVGHAAIVDDTGSVVEVLPGRSSILRRSFSEWKKAFDNKFQVVRYTNSGKAKSAGEWARKQEGKTYKYGIGTTKNSDFSQNYCSKFVWQAYYFGADVKIATYYNNKEGIWVPHEPSGYSVIVPSEFLHMQNGKVVY